MVLGTSVSYDNCCSKISQEWLNISQETSRSQDLGNKRRSKGYSGTRLKGKIVSRVLVGVGHVKLGSMCVEALRP